LIRVQVSHLKSLIARLQDIELDPDLHPTLPNQRLPASAFAWIDDPQIRKIAVTDYTEAHQSLSAGAYKPAAIMAASTIEAMVLYVLRKPSVRALTSYTVAEAALPKDKTGAIAWDRAHRTVFSQCLAPVPLRWARSARRTLWAQLPRLGVAVDAALPVGTVGDAAGTVHPVDTMAIASRSAERFRRRHARGTLKARL
jgi:hypothetical protein